MYLPRPTPDPIEPGQESVWSYPRPPRLERVSKELKIELAGTVIAWTTRGFRVLETSHPPVYFFPPNDVNANAVIPSEHAPSFCEFKGLCHYLDVHLLTGEREVSAPASAFTYPSPTSGFEDIAGYVSFYAGPMDRCSVDGVEVTPQPGGFYSGWITPDIVGPFKGYAGSMGW